MESTPRPLKNKLRFKDEDDLQQYACDEIFKCSGEQPTENNPIGCEGCDAQEEWVDNNYSNMVIEESTEKQFASKRSIKSAVEWYQYNLRILIMDLSEKKITFIEFNEKQKELKNEAFEDVMEKSKIKKIKITEKKHKEIVKQFKIKFETKFKKIKKPYQIPIQNPEELKQVFKNLGENGLAEDCVKIEKMIEKGYMTRLNEKNNVVADFTNMGQNKDFNRRRLIRDKKRYDKEVEKLTEKIMKEYNELIK